jgi:cytochrome oxidase Cu insertion factor (SCO1/SenC/PrrC family)
MSTTERIDRRETWALYGLAAILVVTVGWWAGALWPLTEATPEWVARARAACFGSTESGLPNGGGWILLIGTPPAMIAALWLMGGRELRSGLRALASRPAGRWGMRVVALGLAYLCGLAAVRVLQAGGWLSEAEAAVASAPAPQRLDRVPPPFRLVDQHGERVSLEQFRGRTMLVTFAYGRCTTVCPLIVHESRAAVEELAEHQPVLLILTLDPWRDTPSRLPHLAGMWQLPDDARVLGGSVEEVELVLDGWEIPRSRDTRTGEVSHPSLVYVIDPDGMIAFVATGRREQIVEAVRWVVGAR